MPGIVAALVLGLMTVLWALRRDDASVPEGLRDVSSVMTAVHLGGNAALVILALMASTGQRAVHAMIRSLSVMMIVGICGVMVAMWYAGAPALAEASGEASRGFVAGVMVFSTLFQAAPWLLYLYLFRESRYP